MLEGFLYRGKQSQKFKDVYDLRKVDKHIHRKHLEMKLMQKLEKINVVFDKVSRDYYYANNPHAVKLDINGLSENEIRQKLGLDVVIDFLQLIRDFCALEEIEYNSLDNSFEVVRTRLSIQTEIQQEIQYLFLGEEIFTILSNINVCAKQLAKLLKFKLDYVEEKRIEKEALMGNYLDAMVAY